LAGWVAAIAGARLATSGFRAAAPAELVQT